MDAKHTPTPARVNELIEILDERFAHLQPRDCHHLMYALIELRERRETAQCMYEVLKHFTVRPSFHHDCDDYSRGYGDALAVVATQARAALLKASPSTEGQL